LQKSEKVKNIYNKVLAWVSHPDCRTPEVYTFFSLHSPELARRLTSTQFCTSDPQILGTTGQNAFANRNLCSPYQYTIAQYIAW
jgi:hypothetical protein